MILTKITTKNKKTVRFFIEKKEVDRREFHKAKENAVYELKLPFFSRVITTAKDGTKTKILTYKK